MIFTFAVLIVLCRPFIAYNLAASPKFPKEPSKMVSLMRGLVKKKNEHASEPEEIVEARISKKYFPIRLLFLLLFNKVFWALSLAVAIPFALRRRTLFHISPTNHYYRYICKFQV